MNTSRTDGRRPGLPVLSLCSALLMAPDVDAVEATRLDHPGAEALYGRYAPAGDCGREPRILVGKAGFAFEIAGKTTRTTTFEHAVSYGGHDYAGNSEWFFPFIVNGGYPILMSFDPDKKPAELSIDGHDEGWKGGPPLRPLNAALVKGSPYRKCK